MDGAEIARLFTFSAMTLQRNLDGVGNEHAVRTDVGCNDLNWVLGHIVAARHMAFDVAGIEHVWPKKTFDLFDRGSKPSDEARRISMADIMEAFAATQDRLLAFLDGKTHEDLSQPTDDPNHFLGDTIGKAMTAFAWHEAYHCGQVGLHRRLKGLPGAIE